MILTWSDLVRWAKIDPGALMGVKVGKCEAFDTDRRNHLVNAFLSAELDIAAELKRHRLVLWPTQGRVEASAPYFRLPDYQEPGYILERHLDTTVTITPSSSCPKHRTVATITATMDPPGVDERELDLRVWIDSRALRLETELINVDVQRGVLHWTYTIQAEAWNFIDLDNLTDGCKGCTPDDAAPFVANVKLIVRTVIPSKPRAIWQAGVCQCTCCTAKRSGITGCSLDCTEGCLVTSSNGIATVKDYQQDCRVGHPFKFDLRVVNRGLYSKEWAEAILALGVCNIPATLCVECSSIPSTLWAEMNGTSDRFSRTFTQVTYSKMFGLFKPGAKRAESIIRRVISDAKVGAI